MEYRGQCLSALGLFTPQPCESPKKYIISKNSNSSQSIYKQKSTSLFSRKKGNNRDQKQLKQWKQSCKALIYKPQSLNFLDMSNSQNRKIDSQTYLKQYRQLFSKEMPKSKTQLHQIMKRPQNSLSLIKKKAIVDQTNHFFSQTQAQKPKQFYGTLQLQACQLPILNRNNVHNQTIKMYQKIGKQLGKRDRSQQIRKQSVPSHYIPPSLPKPIQQIKPEYSTFNRTRFKQTQQKFNYPTKYQLLIDPNNKKQTQEMTPWHIDRQFSHY